MQAACESAWTYVALVTLPVAIRGKDVTIDFVMFKLVYKLVFPIDLGCNTFAGLL